MREVCLSELQVEGAASVSCYTGPMALSKQNCAASSLHVCGTFACHLSHKYVLV